MNKEPKKVKVTTTYSLENNNEVITTNYTAIDWDDWIESNGTIEHIGNIEYNFTEDDIKKDFKSQYYDPIYLLSTLKSMAEDMLTIVKVTNNTEKIKYFEKIIASCNNWSINSVTYKKTDS